MSKSKRPRGGAPAEPDLMAAVRAAMVDPGPLHLLSYVSTLLTALEPRGEERPFAAPAPDGPSREELAAMFIDVPQPETTALLTVIAALADDEVLRVRIRRELASRDYVLPDWLGRLDQTSAYRAVRMTHILGDGDNVMVGVRLAGSDAATCVVYVDHNMGQLVKDAFVIPESIEVIVGRYQSIDEDPDTTWEELSLADARAWIDPAIDMAARTFPPLETDSWPACRPLVEWITRTLPAGGTGYQRPQWDSEQLDGLAARFFSSKHGAAFDDVDHRGLLDSILWYATDYGPGDPLRWSDVRIEILLADWLPRKVIAATEYLALAPALLRAFVGFAHDESVVRADLTDQTLHAIDAWAPEYLRAIQASGTDMHDRFEFGPGEYESAVMGPNWAEEMRLDDLATEVGGREQLDALDTTPLPDEPFDWSRVPEDIEVRVGEVLALTDRCCDELLDVEYRTVCRRVLARVASQGPAVFRRKGRVETAAAGLVWIAGKANGCFDYGSELKAMDIAKHFGVKSSPSQRGGVMVKAGRFSSDPYSVDLGSPDYLVAARRERIIRRRDELRQRIASPD
ncbi:MAG: DUF6398 domain-containing protein [Mycobacterium sp.]|nr:DUF6398 domain-containing protein [Mycobacterium sp.]